MITRIQGIKVSFGQVVWALRKMRARGLDESTFVECVL